MKASSSFRVCIVVVKCLCYPETYMSGIVNCLLCYKNGAIVKPELGQVVLCAMPNKDA